MRNRRTGWLSGIGAVILIGGLLAGCGSGDDIAVAQSAPTDLSGVTQAWNKNIPAAQRFAVLAAFANAAVLDKETGLVWEHSPATTPETWTNARGDAIRTIGGRKGWRLPSVHELASLIDPSVAFPVPNLPPGHPFTSVQSGVYWSAALSAVDPNFAWSVNFNGGGVGLTNRADGHQVWCVRGGMQESCIDDSVI